VGFAESLGYRQWAKKKARLIRVPWTRPASWGGEGEVVKVVVDRSEDVSREKEEERELFTTFFRKG
jgi:hypothetical protein